MKKLIIVEISGGLGNQLFQYWMGQRIQSDTDTKIKYKTDSISHHKTPRELEITNFKLENKPIMELKKESELFWIFSRFINSLLLRSKFFRGIFSTLKLRYFATEVGYDESPEHYARYKHVIGQFQSYRYLEPIRERVISQMILTDPSKKFKELATLIEHLEPIVVHVRGGDYNHLKESFGLLDFNYFLSAINFAQEIIGNRQIWLFSDDPDRVSYIAENLNLKFNRIICQNGDLTSSETLALISKGRVVIISNSTFSWWSAWLSSAQTVVAPSKWFKGMPDPKYLYPENWKTIPSTWI
jgi:hypothetical protein